MNELLKLSNEEGVAYMDENLRPDPNEIYPVAGFKTVTYIKPTIKDSSITVGDFTYFGDVDFEKHVTNRFVFNNKDRLIIGKFCSIAKDVEFVMNGANHKLDCVSTFPFYIMKGFNMEVSDVLGKMPNKGDTVVGNDVWIGQGATILPGVKIGDGAIVGLNSVVSRDVEPYCIVAGNPAKFIRKRFDDELIEILLKLKWWDKSVDEINDLIPILTCSDLEKVKVKLKELV